MIRLAVRVSRDRAEQALAELLELAPAGVEEVQLDDHRVEYAVYGPPGELPSLPGLNALAGDTPIEVSTSEIADDWDERWKDFHRPVLIASSPDRDTAQSDKIPSLLIRPPWEPAPPQSGQEALLELVIDPGQAFGTGGHASTRLCLGLLLELAGEDRRRGAVLDVGTGSGVLAIAAAKLGYGPLLGLDNEAPSVTAAHENALVNGVELQTARYDLREDVLPWLGEPGPADEGGRTGPAREPDPAEEPVLLLANLLRPLLLSLSNQLARSPAHLIAGGLLREQLDEVSAAFEDRVDLTERGRRIEGEWGALWLAAES
ncbi:MAG TPA: 50S ribosomal protein L11 methyltransferase [Solirubrobacteraceae bacterium]|nr:50S ribosomal protein L11 methyltransferase [Solirubrobacteraceae bacterium]